MSRSHPFRRSSQTIALAVLSFVLLTAGMCAPTEREPAVDDTAAAESEAALAAARLAAEEAAAAAAEAERLAALAAAEQELAERQAQLAAEQEELRRQRAQAEQERLAAQRAAAAERERQLAARERELALREEQIALREDDLTAEPAAPTEPAGVYDEAWREQREEAPSEVAAGSTAPPAAAPPKPTASLQPGKVMEVEFLETLSSKTSRVGDTFSGRLVQGLRNSEGTLVVPAGAKVIGRVTEVTPLKRVGGQATLGIEFTHIVVPPDQTVGIRASFIEFGADKRKDKKKIAIGAVAGAVLGHILGGDGSKNVLIGAAVGAAAGSAVVAGAKDKDAEIPAGEKVALQLEEVVTVEIRYGDPTGG